MSAEPLPHGGQLEAARRRHPDAPLPFVDLSTGINPVPYAMPDLPPECFTRLPEPEALWRLQAAAARAYRASDPAMVVAGPGTQLLINLLPRLVARSAVAVLAPTYGEHARVWRACGHEVRTVETLVALADAQVAVLCNPNNPDGRRYARSELVGLADRLSARGGLLVVDEAFADLEPDLESLAPGLPHPAIVVLRSFGKTYGLAGVRLGFALADPVRAATLASALGPWAVSGPAITVGSTALADDAWRDAAAARLAADANRLDAVLASAGLPPLGGTRLFRFVESADGARDAEALARQGVLVRAFADLPRRLRFGIPGNRLGWARLEAAVSGLRRCKS